MSEAENAQDKKDREYNAMHSYMMLRCDRLQKEVGIKIDTAKVGEFKVVYFHPTIYKSRTEALKAAEDIARNLGWGTE